MIAFDRIYFLRFCCLIFFITGSTCFSMAQTPKAAHFIDSISRCRTDILLGKVVQDFTFFQLKESDTTAFFLITPEGEVHRLPGWGGMDAVLVQDSAVWAWGRFPQRLMHYDMQERRTFFYPTYGPEYYYLITPCHQFLWFWGYNSLLCFDRKNQSTLFYPRQIVELGLRNIECVGDSIFLSFMENKERFSIDSIIENGLPAIEIWAEYVVFEKDRLALHVESVQRDFYRTIAAHRLLKSLYGDSTNPIIQKTLADEPWGASYALFVATDSVLLRVENDYEQGRFAPDELPIVVSNLFAFYGKKGRLEEALLLADNTAYAPFFENEHYGKLHLVRETKYQLDSILDSGAPPDEILYAAGKVWLRYCQYSGWFYDEFDGPNIALANRHFRELLRQYPESRWADNAAYDTLTYADFVGEHVEELDRSKRERAVSAFNQILLDYPATDCRPKILLRLAKLVQGSRWYESEIRQRGLKTADEYLRELAELTPDVAVAKEAQAVQQRENFSRWSKAWIFSVQPEKPVFKLGGPLRFVVRFTNVSGSTQTLDSLFMRDWPELLYLRMTQFREENCRAHWGDFKSERAIKKDNYRALSVPSGSHYEEIVELMPASANWSQNPLGKFDMTLPADYRISAEIRRPAWDWRGPHDYKVRFRIE